MRLLMIILVALIVLLDIGIILLVLGNRNICNGLRNISNLQQSYTEYNNEELNELTSRIELLESTIKKIENKEITNSYKIDNIIRTIRDYFK